MRRSELIAALHRENPGLRLEEVTRIVDLFFDEIARQMAGGGRVALRGFGVFDTGHRGAFIGRNPATGEAVAIPAKCVPRFRAGKEMRQRVRIT